MELATKASGLVIWLMAKASTFILVELFIKANGRWTNNMGMEKRLGLINLTSSVTSTWGKSMDRESSHLQMGPFIKANIKRMIFKDRAFTPGTTAAPIADIGSIIKCTVKAYSHGKTDADTLANM
jgi:hypothetical protein